MIIIEDKERKKPRKVILMPEIDYIIEALENQPHNIYDFFNYKAIINKLKEARQRLHIL